MICTEVVEHFRRPAENFKILDALLEDDAAFPAWWYHRDATHIAFYRPETLIWIAARRGWTLERPSRDAALFVKNQLLP